MEKINKNHIVLLLNSSFPYYSGGRETWLYNITKHLVKSGYQIHILTLFNTDKNPLHFKDIPSNIEIINCKTLKQIPIIKHFIRSYFNIVDSLYGACQMLRQLHKNFLNIYSNCIFISMDTVFTPIPLYYLKRKRKDITFICSSRGPHADILSIRFPLVARLFHMLEKHSYKTADMIWANGRDTQVDIKNHGFDSLLIENGVDIELIDNKYKFPDEQVFKNKNFKITSVASLLDVKGIKELLEAGAILLKNKISDFDLIFVGKGNPARYIEYAKKLGILQKSHFLGERQNVISYLKNSHLIACLSGGGGMSMSALEALGSKTPVIAWNSPIYNQIIRHGENGYLVTEKDARALADGIIIIKNNYTKFEKMGKNARKSIKNFDWKKIVEKIIFQLKNFT